MTHPLSRLLLLSTTLLTLSACAGATPHASLGFETSAPSDDATQMQLASAAFMKGDSANAMARFGDLAARNPFDPNRQTLLALSYQQSSNGEPEALDMAMAGYDLALKSGQDAFWAAALAGRAAYDRGRYDQAQGYFAKAVLMRPEDSRAFLALATSAYMAGDPQVASLAADRVAELSADSETRRSALRIGALAYAAKGQQATAWTRYEGFSALSPVEAKPVFLRVNELVRTQDTEMLPETQTAPDVAAPDQVSVDVAIILSQTLQKDSVGLNLLDGLQAQYSHQKQSTNTDGNVSRTITESISIPQLTYNLNLFNRFGQYYQVVARPMLTAYRGEPSDFFVGRSAKVAVGGVNFAQLENVDIGTQVKVTPLEISGDRTKLRIEVTRSFLASEPAGNFAEALNTWRQTVATTVEVKFGSTLILSGLSESVRDATGSKTPLMGDAPVVGSLFNKRITTNRRDSVLILVTPAPSQAFAGPAWSRPTDVERLIDLWGTVIAPGSDMATITAGLGHARLFTRAKRDDGRLTWPNLPRDQGEILKDLLLP